MKENLVELQTSQSPQKVFGALSLFYKTRDFKGFFRCGLLFLAKFRLQLPVALAFSAK